MKVLVERQKYCIQTSYKTPKQDSVLLFHMLTAALMLAVQRETDRQTDRQTGSCLGVETQYLYKWDMFV